MQSIEYRMDVTGIPHTYIVIDNGSGASQMYGFAPAAPGHLWGVGRIFDESASGPDGSFHLFDYTTGPIELTTDQFNKVVAEINSAIASPPTYDLPLSITLPGAVNQCANWANHLAEVGGFQDKLPWPSFGGWNPYGQAIFTWFDQFWHRSSTSQFSVGGDPFTGMPWPGESPLVGTYYRQSEGWQKPKDPLTLDLDGGGITATAIDPTHPILFDHNADGIKTATGWIGAGDGLVVIDLNGNGTIDTGRELFGDNTLLPNGARASNGFQAIAQYDTNADGKIDSLDPAYDQLRIWQDANLGRRLAVRRAAHPFLAEHRQHQCDRAGKQHPAWQRQLAAVQRKLHPHRWHHRRLGHAGTIRVFAASLQ